MADYRVGIEIFLAGAINHQLAALSTRMLGLHTTAGQVTGQFNRWAAAIGGVAAVLGGSAIIGGIAKLAEHGKEVAHQLELMNVRGMTFAEIQEANAKALEVTSSVMTTTYSENLKHIQELRYAFGTTEEAIKYLEVVSKANAILNSVRGKFGGKDEVWELVKSGELLGKTAKPEDEIKFIDLITRAVTATGGKVTPAAFMNTIQYGRTAALGWSDEFMGLFLPRLIQSMGGGGGGGARGPGNALMTAFAKIIQGQVSKASAQEFEDLGLGRASHIKGSGSSLLSDVVGRELFLENPYEWIQQKVMPALAAKGITDTLGITTHLSKLMGVRTASGILAEMGLQGRFRLGDESPFEKDKKLTELAMGVNAFDRLAAHDPTFILAAFQAQMKNLGEALGKPIWAPGGAVSQALSGLTVMINAMARFAGAHPELVTAALEALAALGTGLVVVGLVAIAGAIGGLVGVASGVMAAAAAIGTLVAMNWKFIADMFNSIGPAMVSAMSSAINFVTSTIPNLFSELGHAIMEAIRAMIANITGVFTTLPTSPPAAGGGVIVPQVPGGSHGIIETPGGAHMLGPHTGKRSYNAVPPPSGSTSGGGGDGAVYLDGKKVGEILAGQLARAAGGPLQGSAYFDGTQSSPASDLSLSYG